MAKAFVIPTLVAGGLLLILGLGLVIGSQRHISGISPALSADAQAFVASEIARIDKILAQYAVAVFKVMPLIVVVAAILFIVVQGAIWRASLVTTIAMMAVIILVDINSDALLKSYKAALLSARSAQ